LSSTRSFLDTILLDPGAVRDLGRSLFSAIPPGPAPYDRKAALYDAVVGRSLYHRMFWGTSARAFAHFARTAVDASSGGWFAEAGCGSLLFTHALYSEAGGPPAVLVDRSLRMLYRGLKQLRVGGREPRRNVALLHADVCALPVRSGVFSSILSLNLLHVPCEAVVIAQELGRILHPAHGRLFLSCLVRSGRWSDAYMTLLYRVGELAKPWTVEQLKRTVAAGWGAIESTRVDGNMCFMVIRHAGAASTP